MHMACLYLLALFLAGVAASKVDPELCDAGIAADVPSGDESASTAYPPISSDEELRERLQGGMHLELATLPVYMTALYTIMSESHCPQVFSEIRAVLMEEMLHTNIASNLLAAVGGAPEFYSKAHLVTYPGELPLGLGSTPNRKLVVGLSRLSKDLLQAFMLVEQPQTPLIPSCSGPDCEASLEFSDWTIGVFYEQISEYLKQRGNDIFVPLKAHPVFRTTAHQINNTASALKAIDLIISQGEGSTKSPVDADGELSHYYRYAQIFHGRKIVGDPNEAVGFSYTGQEMTCDETSLYPIMANITDEAYEGPLNTYARALNEDTNRFFTEVLLCLHNAWTIRTDVIRECVKMMTVLMEKHQRMNQVEVYDEDGNVIGNASPTYKYVL